MVQAEWLAAAAFAPIVVWLLWRIQALCVNRVLKPGMYKLLRYQRATYNIASWFGVLLHETAHAVFLLIGGHGIRNVSVRVDSGHVTPVQVGRSWYGTLTFLAAALAPIYAAPAVVLVLIVLLLEPSLLPRAADASGLQPAMDVLRDTLVEVPRTLLNVLVGLDVASAAGAAVFLIAVLAMPAARPSFVRKRGAPDEGDIAVFRSTIRRRPLAPLAVLALAYASYFIVVPWRPQWYWLPWQVLWTVAVVGIVLAVLGGAGWYAVALTGRIRFWAAWIPYAAAVAAQAAGRALEQPLWIVNLGTLAVFVVLAVGLRQVAGRRY